MQIIIDIPQEEYEEILSDNSVGSPFEDMISKAIKNGTSFDDIIEKENSTLSPYEEIVYKAFSRGYEAGEHSVSKMLDIIKKQQYNQGFGDGYKNATERAKEFIEVIKTKIKQEKYNGFCPQDYSDGLNKAIEIIDKHIGERSKDD